MQPNTRNPDLQEMLRRGTPLEKYEAQQTRIASPEVRAAAKAAHEWWGQHKPAFDFHYIAVEDYITARGAVLDFGLFHTGLAVAAQAIEKFLKAYLIALGQNYKYNHEIKTMMGKVEQHSTEIDLSLYLDYASQLEDWYESKYPDSDLGNMQWSRVAIKQLDQLVYYLEENFPIPSAAHHLKFGGGELGNQWTSIFVRMFASSYSQHRNVLMSENDELQSRQQDLWERFNSARMLAGMPATTLREEAAHRAQFN